MRNASTIDHNISQHIHFAITTFLPQPALRKSTEPFQNPPSHVHRPSHGGGAGLWVAGHGEDPRRQAQLVLAFGAHRRG